MPYIYKITNLINNKIYIGKTSLPTIEERFKEHIHDSIKQRNEKRPLYDAMNKYGIENFIIEEIEKVENDEIASEREKYWIKNFNSYIGFQNSNGYNATLGGDSRRLYNYEELAKAYLELGTAKAVCQKFNCDINTVRQACLENGIEIKIAPNQRKIKRVDKEGNIKIYNSITEASAEFTDKVQETARKNISRALNRGRLAYNYEWFYI